jgi:uncharacterized membrane protein YidH (DUF202 family)
MPSAAEPPRRPGFAVERTALAWQRMALGFVSLAAVMLAAAAHRHAAWLLAPAGAGFGAAAAVWAYARRRARDSCARTDRRALALLAVAVLGAAVAAAVAAVARPG